MKRTSQESSKKFIEFLAVTLTFSIVWDCCDGWRTTRLVEMANQTPVPATQVIEQLASHEPAAVPIEIQASDNEARPKPSAVGVRSTKPRRSPKLNHPTEKESVFELAVTFDKPKDPSAITVAFKVNLPNYKKNILFDYELPEKTQERMRTLVYRPTERNTSVELTDAAIAVEKKTEVCRETQNPELITIEPVFTDQNQPIVARDSESLDNNSTKLPNPDGEPAILEPTEPVVAEDVERTDSATPDEPSFYGPVVPANPQMVESPQK